MNSLILKEKGFAEFVPLKELAFSCLPYNKASVIVIATSDVEGKPTSDILYIGRSKKPTKRVFGGYLAAYGGRTTRKISSKLLDEGYLEKATISWMLTDNPKTAQQELLESFKKEHGEYPAWNSPKKTLEKPKPVPKTAKSRSPRKTAKPIP